MGDYGPRRGNVSKASIPFQADPRLSKRYKQIAAVMNLPTCAEELVLLAEEHAKLERLRGSVDFNSDSRAILDARISQIEEEQDEIITENWLG